MNLLVSSKARIWRVRRLLTRNGFYVHVFNFSLCLCGDRRNKGYDVSCLSISFFMGWLFVFLIQSNISIQNLYVGLPACNNAMHVL